jgi:hypothetical protein
MIKQPQYVGLEEARQLLAQMGVRLTLRQMRRAAEQDAQGRRKLPFFVDPIERMDSTPCPANRSASRSLVLIARFEPAVLGTHAGGTAGSRNRW